MPTIRNRLARHVQDRSTEWLSSLVMLGWGVTLAMPGDTLQGPAYAAFMRFDMTEPKWALAFILCSTLRILSLWINGRWPRTPWIRMAMALFGAITWAHVANSFYQNSMEHAGPWGTGILTYAILALYDLVAIYRANVDVRYYKPV